MAPTFPKFGLTLRKGADGTAGAVAGSPAAAKRQKTAGEYKVSNNFGAVLRCNPAHGKSNKPVGADGALAPPNVGRAADTMQMAKTMDPLKVRRPANAAKVVDLIPSDNDDGLLDLKTTPVPAAKPTSQPLIVPPPYKGQDLDIDGRNRLDGLDRLNKLQDLAQWG
jgi:hypothetical protein